jgi:hypothetical protein
MQRFVFLLLILPLLIVSVGFTSATLQEEGVVVPPQLTPTTTPTSTGAPAAQPIQLVNHLGGRSEAVFAEGNYAYVNFGPELAVVDVSKPAQPVRVGYTILPGLIKQIQVVRGVAYVITQPGGLHIVDVSDPTAPQAVGSYNPPGPSNRVAVVGSYAYLATEPQWNGDQQAGGGLYIVDISSPAAPRETGFYASGSAVTDVAILAESAPNPEKIYAYIATWEDTPRIVDVSQPSAPQAADASVSLPDYSELLIRDNYAYLLGSSSLYLMDLSTPTEPVEVGVYQTWGQLASLALGGDYAYLINTDGGYEHSSLQIVDISSPAQPSRTGGYNLKGYIQGVAASGKAVYLATGYLGLRLIDVAEPAQPVEAGFYAPPAPVETMSRSDGYGYVQVKLEDGEGLSVLNLAGPSNPVEMSRYGLPDSSQNGWGVAVSGVSTANPTYSYSVQRTLGEFFTQYYLQLLDISNPAAPVTFGAYRTVGSQAEGLAVAHDPSGSSRLYAYLPTGSMGLRVVEVTDPLVPVEVGAYAVPPALTGVLQDELKLQDYTVQIYDNAPDFTKTLVILKSDHPIYVQEEWGFYFDDSYDRDQPLPAEMEAKDITGNDIPDLIVRGFTGGAHCCESTYIFELGEALRLVDVIDTAHSSARFEDLDGDTIPEVRLNDWTFAYWATAFASSPAPEVILRYQAGRYRPAIDLMRRPAPEDLEAKAQEIQAETEEIQETGPSPLLWHVMLDLIYSGQTQLAWSFFEENWPADLPGKEDFLVSFLSQLSTSPYWPEIQKLNEGQWPALLDTIPTEAELPPLPTSDKVGPASEAPVILPPFSIGQDSAGLSGENRGPVETVFVQGNYAYAGTGAALTVLDITIPSQPRPVGYLALPGRVKDIYVEGTVAYLAKASDWVEGENATGGLWTVDVSDPKVPTLTNFYETVGELDDLTLLNGYLYSVEQPGFYEGVSDINGGLRMFDISQPAAPQEAAFYEMSWKPGRIDIIGTANDYIYLGAEEGGLFILHFDPVP